MFFKYFQHSTVLLWFLAFVASFTPIVMFQSELVGLSLALLVSALCLSLYGMLKHDRITIPRNELLLILGVFWLVALVSVIWSQSQWISYVQFWVFSCLPLSALLFLFYLNKDRIIQVVVYALSGLAIFSLVQYYVIPDMLFEGRVKWPLHNPNSLGAVFSIGLFMALGHMACTRSRLSALCACLLILGLLVTGSRGALGAAIVMSVFGVVVMRDYLTMKMSHIIVTIGVLVAVAMVLAVTGMRPDNVAITTIPKTLMGDYPFLWSRADIWQGTWEIIKSYPLTGTGIGTFPHFYAQHQSATDVSAGITAHNDPLQIWAEMGVGAFILFYLFCVMMFVKTMKALRLTTDRNQRIKILMPFCALGAMVIHGHVSSNLHNVPILFLSGLLIAYWVCAIQDVTKHDLLTKKIPYTAKMGRLYRLYYVLNIWVLLVLLVGVPFVSNYYAQNSLRYSRFNNIEKLVDNVNKAKVWSFGLNPQPYIQAAPIHISLLEHDLDILMRRDKQNRVKEIEDMINKTERLSPRAVGVFYNRALLARALSDDDPSYHQIDEYLHQAIKYKPRHLRSRLWLVDRYVGRQEYEQAVAVMEGALPWCGRGAEALLCYTKLSELYILNGQMDQSGEMVKKIKRLSVKK